MATTTGGAEVLIRDTAKVVNPADYSPDIISNGSRKYLSNSETSLDSEEDVDNYKRQYEEENEKIYFSLIWKLTRTTD